MKESSGFPARNVGGKSSQSRRPSSGTRLEVASLRKAGASRDSLMVLHKPTRNIVGAMEKALAEELLAAGYIALNEVKWRHPIDEAIWSVVRAAFAIHFPKLARSTSGKGAI